MKISLRKSIAADLAVFFQNQRDETANYMAAFTAKDPNDEVAYMEKWQRLIKDVSIHMQTIVLENEVIGCVVKYVMEGDAEITYALSKAYWGKGITTIAVKEFLKIEPTRPIHARVAYDNFASQKVLEKVGFQSIGKDIGFANARGKEIEEYIYRLD